MVFGGWIGDLREFSFVEDFLFLELFCVRVTDFVYVFPLIISLDFSLFVMTTFN